MNSQRKKRIGTSDRFCFPPFSLYVAYSFIALSPANQFVIYCRCKRLVEEFIKDTNPECRLMVGGDMRMIQLCFQLLKVNTFCYILVHILYMLVLTVAMNAILMTMLHLNVSIYCHWLLVNPHRWRY